jgi:FtsH-binding integral membrane protein
MPGLLRARALNFVLYQAGWFCCILGAARGRPWLGAGLGLLAVLAHLALARRRRAEASLTLGALALGIVVDTVHMRMGTLTFHGGLLLPDFPPPWLLILWLQFATTLRYCLSWRAGRYALGAILGAVAGAAAYWAGVRLGAASFGVDTTLFLVRIGVSWGLCLPLLLLMAERGEEGGGEYRIFQ